MNLGSDKLSGDKDTEIKSPHIVWTLQLSCTYVHCQRNSCFSLEEIGWFCTQHCPDAFWQVLL